MNPIRARSKRSNNGVESSVSDQTNVSDGVPPDAVPLVLVAEDRDERTRWLVRLLEEAKYAVLRERTARHAGERPRTAHPDLIIIAADLPDESGVALCRGFRRDPPITSSTPIFLTFPPPPTPHPRSTPLPAGSRS